MRHFALKQEARPAGNLFPAGLILLVQVLYSVTSTVSPWKRATASFQKSV